MSRRRVAPHSFTSRPLLLALPSPTSLPCHSQQPLREAGWVSRHTALRPRAGQTLQDHGPDSTLGHNQSHLLWYPHPLCSLRTWHIFVLCFRTISIKVAELVHTKICFLNKSKITIFIDMHVDGWECVHTWKYDREVADRPWPAGHVLSSTYLCNSIKHRRSLREGLRLDRFVVGF